MSEFIDKVKEYRVYVMKGRVISIAEKIPNDPDQIAWNVAQGGVFNNVRWDNWPLNVAQVGLDVANKSEIDFTGVDVMVDREGKAWFIEANSAPSLPFLSDGSVSYRQKCMAKGFAYHYHNGWNEGFDMPVEAEGWRDVIHPAIWSSPEEG